MIEQPIPPAPPPQPTPGRCPFCRCEIAHVQVVTIHELQSACPPEGFKRFAARCILCGARGPVSGTLGLSPNEACTLWAEAAPRRFKDDDVVLLQAIILEITGDAACQPLIRDIEEDSCDYGCGAPIGQECDDDCSRVARLLMVDLIKRLLLLGVP